MTCNLSDGHVTRLDELALIEHILEIDIRLFLRNTDEFFWLAVRFGNANNDVAATPIIEIIGKRAYRFKGMPGDPMSS